jgi:hypothetical protein
MKRDVTIVIHPKTEEQIIRYLLDEMSADERSRLEDHLQDDPSFCEFLAAAEDDLIAQYLRGELDSRLRSRFKDIYMNSPSKRARVESTRVWREAVTAIATARKARTQLRPRLGPRLAAVAAVATIAITVAVWSSRKHVPSPSAVEPEKENSYASFQLEPNLTRSPGGTQITLPPGVKEVRLELFMPNVNIHTTYQAVLSTPEQSELQTSQASPKNSSVEVAIPAQALSPGDYTLTVRAGGKDVAMFSFRVAR